MGVFTDVCCQLGERRRRWPGAGPSSPSWPPRSRTLASSCAWQTTGCPRPRQQRSARYSTYSSDVSLCHSLNMELDLKKFIWAPVHSCAHWLRTPASPPLPLHLGSYTKALLVSQERPTSPCKPLVFAIFVPKLLFFLL
jgi:hypothetical protein